MSTRLFVIAGLVAVTLMMGLREVPAGPGEAGSTIDFRAVIRAAKQKVFPAVLYVRCIRVTTEEGKKRSGQISGSGVLLTAKGEFLTNWHVVDKAEKVRCLLFDGRARSAEVLGTDKDTDLALCRLKTEGPNETFPHAVLGQSRNLTEGDFVMAMGAPWGLSRSVSLGIVSCTRRYLDGNSEYSLWLQTDASISPGNSGGPLVDTAGLVIGINTRGIMSGGDMGFAIPSETIERVVAQLREHGKVAWSWTGLHLQPLRDFEQDIYFEGSEGVIVSGTDPESPARRAGILPQDRLLSVDGVALRGVTAEDLPAIRRRLGLLRMGKGARLTLLRGQERVEVQVVPRAKGAVEGEELACPRWDFSAKAINQFDNPDLYFHRKEGVFVYGVRSPGNASNAGLRRGDIILKIGSSKIQTLEQLEAIHEEAVKNVAKRHRLTLTVLRDGLLRQLILDFARDYERE